MNFKLRSGIAAAIVAITALACGSAPAAVNLPALNIDKTQTTVSGLSSGGYMAVQLHVAYSATFKKGAGIVADDGVSARRDELRLRADHLTSTPDGNHIVLTGNVVITNEQGARVLSREARYDRLAQKIYATGDVYLQDPKRGLRQRGKKLVADLKLNKATLEGVTGSGRMNVFSDKKLF